MSSPTTRSEEQPMSNPGMDADVFAQFIEQLQRYVRERLLPAAKVIVETDRIPDDILAEMRDMGLFGMTIPEQFGGAGMNVSQYVKTVHTNGYAMLAFRPTSRSSEGRLGKEGVSPGNTRGSPCR